MNYFECIFLPVHLYTIFKYMSNYFLPERTSYMKTYFSIKGIFNPTSHTEPESAPLTPRDMLLADIQKTQCALEIAYSGFDNVTDPDLIDCYIYQLQSAQLRYKFLLNCAKKAALRNDF